MVFRSRPIPPRSRNVCRVTDSSVLAPPRGVPGFVDTHFHIWDPTVPGLRYEQLETSYDNGALAPRLDRLKGTRYLIGDYLSDLADVPLRKAVHVQAALGTLDPVSETAWIQQVANESVLPIAIVAHADLRSPDVERDLTRQCEFSGMRGLRVMPASREQFEDPAFQRGYALLAKYDLICGFACRWPAMDSARGLCEKHPEVRLMLDHAGLPLDGDDAYFKEWAPAISRLAGCERVWCKISGLALCNPNWTVDSLRPWVRHCIDSFGPQRIVFGSNWPVDKFTPFTDVFDAYVELTAGYGAEAQALMLAGNAETFYFSRDAGP